jgi:hypothetical protein
MKRVALALCVMVSSVVFAQNKSFLPENDLWKEDNYFHSNMSEATFNQAIDSVERVYGPIVRQMGARLVINRLWQDSTVNAYADRNDGNWNVSMFGGLARRPEVTPEGFVLVVAHELGHHIAGFPLYQGDDWASNEGNSDYFATHVAAKKIFANTKEEVPYLSAAAVAKCKRYYKLQDLRVCYHTMAASQSLANLLAALNGNQSPRFETPDRRVVSKTSDAHPAAQCRLDTMASGAVCLAKWNDQVIPDARNQAQYNCMSGESARPRCWFAP